MADPAVKAAMASQFQRPFACTVSGGLDRLTAVSAGRTRIAANKPRAVGAKEFAATASAADDPASQITNNKAAAAPS